MHSTHDEDGQIPLILIFLHVVLLRYIYMEISLSDPEIISLALAILQHGRKNP